jgi:hypothetical protein
MRRLLPLAVAGLLLLGACGSSGGSTAASTSSTSAPPYSPADKRISEAFQLVAADLPGFQEVSPETSEVLDLARSSKSVPACDFFRDADKKAVLGGRSGGFQRGTVKVNSSVAIFDTPEAAQAMVELFRDPLMVQCLNDVYAGSGSSVSVSPIAPNDLGDDRVAYRITPAAQADSPDAKVVDVIVVRVGRAVFSFNVSGGTAADSAEVQSNALPKVVDRIRAAEA